MSAINSPAQNETQPQLPALAATFLRFARDLLEQAQIANSRNRGHIAANLLYDCFENICQAGILLSGADLPDKRIKGVHGRRKKMFSKIYRGRVRLARLRVVIERREAIKYIDADTGVAPWDITEFKAVRMASTINMMGDLLEELEKQGASVVTAAPAPPRVTGS